jgi:hypothetical protein
LFIHGVVFFLVFGNIREHPHLTTKSKIYNIRG